MIALMKQDAAHQLDGIRPLTDHPFRRFARGGEGFRKQLVQTFALA